jgi:hypothetical protein
LALLKIQSFGGEVPVQGIRALPDAMADESVNTWLYSQELRAIHPNVKLRDTITTTRDIFRIPRGTVGGDPSVPGVVPPPSYLGDSTWVEFTDPNTDVVRGPLINDSFKRWYFCSPTTGLMFNTTSRLINGDPIYKVGVPNPTATMGLSVTGGVATANVTRAYLYTFVNMYGEESGPSPPITGAGKPDGIWHLTGIADPPVDATRAPYDHKTLYRSITSASGTTTFFKVADISLGTTIYDDNGAVNTDAILAGNLSFENTNGNLPPANLQGIIAMPNGFLIGWVDSDLWFSEPYKPFSWPAEYVVSTEYPIIGLGVFGQSCAVLTQGFPGVVTGITPATTALSKSTVMEPCLNRTAIVSTPEGVYYPSPNGLVSISANGVNNITQKLITKEEWLRDFSPAYLRACRYQQGYLALRAGPDIPNRTAFYLDLSDLRTAVTELSEFDNAYNVVGDVWSAEIFVIRLTGAQNTVQHYDPQTNFFLPYRWKSKEFQYVFKTNFSCYELFWDADRYDAVSTDAPEFCPVGKPARIRVWADRALIYDETLLPVDNSTMLRLPSGFKALVWQFEINGRAPVFNFHVASTVKELRGA